MEMNVISICPNQDKLELRIEHVLQVGSKNTKVNSDSYIRLL